jgi:UDP-N-acetylmuramyl pentapeptide phosphotransferase/UDP-N-acetylglucosamine-1-phosphate transferase
VIIFIYAFLASLLVTSLVVHYSHIHQHHTADHDLHGVQKFHAVPVPRIGGIGLFLAALIVLVILRFSRTDSQIDFLTLLLICSLPAFAAGLIEDITKRVGVLTRLSATMFSSAIAFYLMDGQLHRLSIPGLDTLLQWELISLLVTMIAVAGIANSVNIIDGFNGLASVVSIIILLALGYVAFKVGDMPILIAAMTIAGALLGFLLWNWPWGLIFLGDGGAYFVGFWIAELSVLLVARNPSVSPWFPVLLVAYPLVETLFTIYRRTFFKKVSAGLPDAAHLHQLIFKRLVRWLVGSQDARHLHLRNSMTSPYLWTLSSMAIIPAVLFWQNTLVLLLFFTLYGLTYIWLYQSLIRFKTPNWLTFHKIKEILSTIEDANKYGGHHNKSK